MNAIIAFETRLYIEQQRSTFGVRDDVIVLKAETALAVAEPFADNIAGGILAPPLWVSTWHYIRVCPAGDLRFRAEEPWPLLFVAGASTSTTITAATAMTWR